MERAGSAPSLPSSAGLEPPLGSAPSSSPLGNAGRAPPPVSAGRSWGRVLPYLRRSPSARPHQARPRDARVRPGAAGGEGRRGPAGDSRRWERGGGRSGAGCRGCRGPPVTGGSGCRPGCWRCWGAAGSRRDGGAGGVRVAPRGEECLLETITPHSLRCLCDFCGNRKVSSEG